MLSDRLKQRLVGVAVLVALAVIFIPVLFNFQPSRPVDQETRIPPAPEVEPVEFEEPEAPAVDNEVPGHDDVFPAHAEQPVAESQPVEEQPALDEPIKERELPQESAAEVTSKPDVAPKLAPSGLPESWVIQVIAYSEQGSAEKLVSRLQQADFRAFYKQGVSGDKKVFRVFVGPFVSRKSAEEDKKLVDSSLGVKSFILAFEP